MAVFPIKKLFFYTIVVAINYLLIEGLAYGLFRGVFGDYDRQAMQLDRIQTIRTIESGPVFTGETAQTADAEVQTVREILHPYAGYTVEGKRLKDGCDPSESSTGHACYERILLADDKPFPKRDANSLNVALLGGSVAVGTITGTEYAAYEKLLSQLPEYAGKTINLHLLAAGGYRLPQSLMLLNYYISLGAEYDLVIALDGFNEIAIAMSEYHHKKLHPAFPRGWQYRIAGRVSAELIKAQAQKLVFQEQHRSRATFLSNPWCRNSPLSNFVWKLFQRGYNTKLAENHAATEQAQNIQDAPREFQYESLGPEYNFTDWDELFDYSAQIWAKSTLLTHAATVANGGEFFQFVQPNQYIEGAKPLMSENERRIAFVVKEQSGYGYWYKRGYPFLLEHRKWLQEHGVNTTDLTFMFKDVADELYIDNCCHLNPKGSYKIIEHIVDTIHQHNLSEAKGS